MSEARFTPGPWEVDGTKALGAYGVWTRYGTHPGHDGESYPSQICSMKPYGGDIPQEQRDANARLIAAAPCLFAALAGLIEAVERDSREKGISGFTGARLTDARAALARAAGPADAARAAGPRGE